MDNGPLPTRLVFLSDLATTPPGTKTRFLGCVTEYNPKTGFLTLQHAYPPPPSPCSTALVDVNLLLESLKNKETRLGEWVNVVGYIELQLERSESIGSKGRGYDRDVRMEKQHGTPTRVQAVMIWSAGGVKLAEYERTLAARIGAEQERDVERPRTNKS